MNNTMAMIVANVLPFVIVKVLPFAIVIGIFYFLMIVPEKKRKKNFQAMLEGLKVGDEIVTRGGIVGKISHIEEKYVTIESSPAKTKIKIDKSGIGYKLSDNK